MVLLVDDEHNNLFIIGKFLENLGFEYQTANNGEEALSKCENSIFDLFLLDIQLPGMDGTECAKEIRELSNQNASTHIIALTAQIFREELNKYQYAGINDYLIKPFDPKELGDIIKKYYNPNNKKLSSGSNRSIFPRKYKLINLDYANRLAKGDRSFLVELLSTIAEDLPLYLTELENAWQKQQIGLVKKTAHKINSPLSNIGLNGLQSISYFENINPEEVSIQQAEEVIEDLRTTIEKVIKEISEELKS